MRDRWPDKPWRWEILVIASLILALAVVGWLRVGSVAEDAGDAARDAKTAAAVAKHFSVELRNGLVRSCRKNGNPLRATFRREQRRQIKATRDEVEQSRNLPPEFFPSIPPEQLHMLIHEQNRKRLAENRAREREIERNHSIDCASLYPKEPKSVAPSE